MSPKGSMTNGRGRSASNKSSRYGSRPEPELEGRPLDSFVNTRKGSSSIPEQDEGEVTLTRPVLDLLSESPDLQLRMTNPDLELLESNVDLELRMPVSREGEERPMTSGSGTTFDQAQKAFADFDGEYVPQRRSMSGNESNNLL